MNPSYRKRASFKMAHLFAVAICTAVVFCTAGEATQANQITGDPSADGWFSGGNALSNGTYVKGNGNYGYETFSVGLIVESGSDLDIADGAFSWLPGDTVLGVGGRFESITPGEAGWAGFTGGAVNALLPAGDNPSALKLQAKFGTNLATWFTSSTAPDAGDGNSSSSSGGGRVQIRTSGFFGATVVTPGQTEPWTWAGNSGQLLVLDKSSHIDWDGVSPQPDKRAARMIWNYDATSGHVSSWELLLNTSLLDRLVPGQLLPAIGDQVVLTVQNGSGPFTDALVETALIPEPSAMVLAAFGFVGVAAWSWRRKRA